MRAGSEKERNKSYGNEVSVKTPGLAEYAMPVLEEARRQNPHLARLDRLAEALLPRLMTHWPYLVGKRGAE